MAEPVVERIKVRIPVIFMFKQTIRFCKLICNAKKMLSIFVLQEDSFVAFLYLFDLFPIPCRTTVLFPTNINSCR